MTEPIAEGATTGTHYDVIVVGGGPGGAYAAWRLKTGIMNPAASGLPRDPADRKIMLLEGSNRIGGRLESLVPPGTPDLRAEFGGMGYSAHDTTIKGVVEHFGLKHKPFVLPNDNDLVYVRGAHLKHSQLKDPSVVPYRLAQDEVGKSPGELIEQAVDKVVPGGTTFTTAQWRAAAKTLKINGRLLGDLGYWNVLLQGMSNEAFNFCTDTMGHFFEFDNWNAAQALPWLLSQSTAPYTTLDDGYDGVPRALYDAYIAAGGGSFLQSSVKSVTQDGNGTLTVTTLGQQLTADRVILAMPRRSLEIIAPDSVVLSDPAIQSLMGSITGRRVMKIFLTYQQAWWNKLGITSGASNTDLPMSQCWYFDPPAGSSNALLMASYNDTLKTTYWQGYEGGTPFPASGPQASQFWNEQIPSEAMVDEVQRQLAEMHEAQLPDPYSAAYKDWEKDPFGGAFYTWNVGVDVGSVAQQMLKPDPNVNLHVCGSAYSQDQGWAEGALVTAEEVMHTYVGLLTQTWT